MEAYELGKERRKEQYFKEKKMKDFGKSHSKGRAGLPEEVKFSEYPKCSYLSGDLDDTITGIDEVKNKSVSKAKKHMSHQK